LEPAMRAGTGNFARIFSKLVGSGPGAGMGLWIVFCGLGAMLIGASGYFIPAIRNADTALPDHDQVERV
jgi:DHA3 family macrolide efflux protein-like MFS transporter